MDDTVVKEIKLENNQTLVISDLSRKIAKDAYVVIMKAFMQINIEPDLFTDVKVGEFKYEDICATLGDKVIYEYTLERNFIMDHEKDGVFESLVDSFLNNLGRYVAKPQFPAKLVLKEYKDRL